MEFEVHKCSVGVEKPSALASVEGAGVEITRTRAFFSESTFWGTDDGDLST
jgi:hypothetical protein